MTSGTAWDSRSNQIGPGAPPQSRAAIRPRSHWRAGDTTAIITYNDLIAVGIVLRFTADGVKSPVMCR